MRPIFDKATYATLTRSTLIVALFTEQNAAPPRVRLMGARSISSHLIFDIERAPIHNVDESIPLGVDDIERFWRDGAICVRDAFRSWIEPMRAAIEDVLLAPGPLAQDPARADYSAREHERARSFHIELGLWSRHPCFRAFALQSAAMELACGLLRSDSVNLFFDQLFVKEPQSSEQRTPWHQDQAYWPISGNKVVSVWVPFDSVSEGTGVVRYVKGSHLWGTLYCPADFGPGQRAVTGVQGEPMPDIDGNASRYEFLTWDLEPGDCLIHHGMTLHGAPGNASASTRRRAHSIRFTGDDVRWDPRPGILEHIPLMTTLPLQLSAGDSLTCEAFPLLRSRNAG